MMDVEQGSSCATPVKQEPVKEELSWNASDEECGLDEQDVSTIGSSSVWRTMMTNQKNAQYDNKKAPSSIIILPINQQHETSTQDVTQTKRPYVSLPPSITQNMRSYKDEHTNTKDTNWEGKTLEIVGVAPTFEETTVAEPPSSTNHDDKLQGAEHDNVNLTCGLFLPVWMVFAMSTAVTLLLAALIFLLLFQFVFAPDDETTAT